MVLFNSGVAIVVDADDGDDFTEFPRIRVVIQIRNFHANRRNGNQTIHLYLYKQTDIHPHISIEY